MISQMMIFFRRRGDQKLLYDLFCSLTIKRLFLILCLKILNIFIYFEIIIQNNHFVHTLVFILADNNI